MFQIWIMLVVLVPVGELYPGSILPSLTWKTDPSSTSARQCSRSGSCWLCLCQLENSILDPSDHLHCPPVTPLSSTENHPPVHQAVCLRLMFARRVRRVETKPLMTGAGGRSGWTVL